MRQIIATTKEGLATNKGLATGKKGSVTTEQSLATIKEGFVTTEGRFQINRERLFKETVYLLAVHNFLSIHRCIHKISMVPTHACLNIEFVSICHFIV